MLSWYPDEAALGAALAYHRPAMDAADAWVEVQERLEGYCSVCQSRTAFQVNTGVMLGVHPSLREGLLCPDCGLVNRNRLLYDAIASTPLHDARRGLALEATTPLFVRLHARMPWLEGSEYFGPAHAPGEWVSFKEVLVQHQSITALGHADASLDLLVHNDVLEHVEDTAAALAECRRVLRAGGVCVFTMPFFPYREHTLRRGRQLADGSIEHIEPPEYHGDGLRLEGIYTFFHFGMDFLGMVRAAGFARVEVGMDFDVFRGYTTNNHRYGDEALMPPIVFRAWA